MPIVFLGGVRYLYRSERLYAGSVEIDIDRMLIDSSYPDTQCMSALVKYTLKSLLYMDEGIYIIHTNPTRTTNILSGTFTETGDFGDLFSFQTLLRRVLC